MSNPSKFSNAQYNTESTWGDSAGGTSFGTALRLTQPVDVSGLTRESLPVPMTQQYAEEGVAQVPGAFGGEFSITQHLTGHGGATTGSLTETDLSTLLGLFVGSSVATGVGDTLLSGTSATEFADNGSFSGAAGDLIRVGVASDARGNGQLTVVNSASTITALVALDGTPNAGDQIYAGQLVFPDERATNHGSVSSTRWQFQTANDQYRTWGCFPKGISISGFDYGQFLEVTTTYGVSYWQSGLSETFPSGTTDAKDPSPVTLGSVFINDVGTTTRTTYSPRSWSININQEVVPLMGPGDGTGADGQIIVGATRVRCNATLSMQFDAEAAGTTTWADKWDAGTNQHILITIGSGEAAQDGKMLGFYFPNCAMVGNRPTQTNADGLNRVDTEWRALTGTNTSSARAMSSWRLFMG